MKSGQCKYFRLYRSAAESSDQLILTMAIRPEYSNASQSEEDDARDVVDRRLDELAAREAAAQRVGVPEPIATWEGGLPEGDCFYEPASSLKLNIWFALDLVHRGYFVFGIHPDEASFWNCVEDISTDGYACPIGDYERPATCATIRFVQ